MRTNRKLMDLVVLSLLSAVIFLLGQTPLGLIPLGFCNVTILCVPVAVGTMLLEWKRGLVLGLVFGATSFLSALLKPSVLVSTLMGANPFLCAVMTFLPRLMIPLTVWGVYALMHKRFPRASMAVAAAAGSLTNTVLYLGMMLLFYTLCGIDNSTVLTLIGVTAGGAGPAEAAVAAILCPPITAALQKIRK